jgi:hypothetical protein
MYHVLEQALPKINAPILPVMQCVLDLVKEAGQDLAVDTLFSSYVDFCSAHKSRPKEALTLIKNDINQLVDLLDQTLIAGSKLEIEHYFNQTIDFTKHESIEVRKKAIFALGRISYTHHSTLIKDAISTLELISYAETDDNLLVNIIISALFLYEQDNKNIEQLAKIIGTVLSKGGDYSLYAAAQIFTINNNILEPLLNVTFPYLQNVKLENKGTLGRIDYGLSLLLKTENSIKAIQFLEQFLVVE